MAGSKANHLEELKKHCRLCGSDKAIPSDRAPKHKLKCSDLVLKATGINVRQDNNDIFPDFVCHCCFLKLQRWKNNYNKRKPSPLNITYYQFEAHSDPCDICKGNTDVHGIILNKCKQFGFDSWMFEKSCILVTINKPGTCILKRVCVNEESEWELDVRGHKICDVSRLNPDIPQKLQDERDVDLLLTFVQQLSFCEGNGDIFNNDDFSKLRGDDFLTEQFFTEDGNSFKTIYHKNCNRVSQSSSHRCDICAQYRNDLFAKRSRLRNPKWNLNLASHTRNDLLSSPHKKNKLKLLKKKQKTLRSKVNVLEQRIIDVFRVEGVSLQSERSELIKDLFLSQEDHIKKLMQPGSPQFLLWEQQKANLTKPANRWRWHPEIIKWCVSLHAKSPSAYNLIRQSGFLSLPSLVTINKYVHFTQSGVGLIPAVLQRIVSEISAPPGDKKENITLVMDEMKIKSGLVFSASSGKLIGFADTGSINNLLKDFEARLSGNIDAKTLPLASHVLVLMVRSIFDSFKAPVAYFATKDLSGDDLYPIVWECVRHLELLDLHVRAIIGDGASPNRKFFKLHQASSNDGLTYFTCNPFSDGDRIYFFCDVPHLLKTTRNNWENSGSNQKSRHLRFRGKDIQWHHLLALQNWDQQLNAPSPGLRLVYKLTYEHINLTPSLRMRVYLAAQVLSSTVANAIECMGNDEMSSTVFFIRKMNEWFDCMNVANTTQHIRSRNPRLAPYRTVDDERFQWLESNFLAFLSEWYHESQNAEDIPKKERCRLFLSRETYTGHQITVKSFVSLAKELLQLPDVEYVLSEKFSQDPLEEYFSKQRGCGGNNDNPTVEQFGHNTLSLMVAGSKAMKSVRGNCRKRPRDEDDL